MARVVVTQPSFALAEKVIHRIQTLQIIFLGDDAPAQSFFAAAKRPDVGPPVQPLPHLERHRFRLLQRRYHHAAIARKTYMIVTVLTMARSIRNPPQHLRRNVVAQQRRSPVHNHNAPRSPSDPICSEEQAQFK